MTNAPIFILGSHKSGTSLLRSLLDDHPDLYVIPFETHFMASLGRWIKYSYRRQSPAVKAEYIQNLLQVLENYSKSKDRQADVVLSDIVDIDKAKEFLNKSEDIDTPEQALSLFNELLPEIIPEMGDPKGKRMVEKSVEHAEMAMELYRCFPHAQFIHIVKNPYANFVALRKFKSKDQGYPLVNKVFGSLETGYFFLDKNEKSLPNYKVLLYEDLARDPSTVLKGVADFLNITFDDKLLQPSLLGSPWSGNSAYGEFKGISSEFLDNWKDEIHPFEANLITQNLSHVLEKYGYEKQRIIKGSWKRAKGESFKRYLYNRFYPYYLR